MVLGQESPRMYKINLVLSILVLVMIVGYVSIANFTIAQRYMLDVRKTQFNSISAELSSTNAGNTDLKQLLLFANQSGMVEAKDTATIIQNSGFALSSDGR